MSDGLAGICITPAQRSEILNFVNDTWGPDCILGTPDDDSDDIGQDECVPALTWDQTICSCMKDVSNTSLCPATAPICIQANYDPF